MMINETIKASIKLPNLSLLVTHLLVLAAIAGCDDLPAQARHNAQNSPPQAQQLKQVQSLPEKHSEPSELGNVDLSASAETDPVHEGTYSEPKIDVKDEPNEVIVDPETSDTRRVNVLLQQILAPMANSDTSDSESTTTQNDKGKNAS